MLTKAVRAGIGLLLTAALVPAMSDPAHADNQAWARQLGADFRKAQTITHGKGVTVAVLSSGVDPSVRTLTGAVKAGRDFYGHRTKNTDGTVIASFIAGSGPSYDSPFSIRGLAPAADILPVRIVPDSDDKSSTALEYWESDKPLDAMVQGIRYAADQGARVILVTEVEAYLRPTQLGPAIDYARGKGSVVITPIVKEGHPGDTPGVIGVGALDSDGSRYAKYSDKSSAVLVSAPGFKMPTTGPGNLPYLFWGGIPAAAWVAGAAALIVSEHPKLTAAQVAAALTTSARHPRGGYNTEVGFGTINPAGALDVAKGLEKRPPADTAPAPIADTAHFGGKQPSRIAAVQPGTGLLAGLWSLVAAGALALLLATVLLLRARRRPHPAGPPLDQLLTPQPALWPPPASEAASEPSSIGDGAAISPASEQTSGDEPGEAGPDLGETTGEDQLPPGDQG